MKTKIIINTVLPIFLLAIFAGGTLAAQKPKVLPADEAKSTEVSKEPLPAALEGMQPECEDINPEMGWDYIEQIATWGWTFYDEQQVGSMGRMIAIGPDGHRGMVFHERDYLCDPDPGYVFYNCKDPLGVWCCAPEQIDGGPYICAGYPNIGVMHDGREVIVYHRTDGLPTWWSTLAMGDEDLICTGFFTDKYDLPDWLQADEYGMWPKMGIVYDAYEDTNYFHIVMTEGKTSNQRLGYIRCHLLANGDLLCETPVPNGTVSPIIVPPNVPGGGEEIAYFGEVAAPGVPPGEYPNTISAVVATSPVSQKVAIVFTNKREAGDNTMNNDVFYFESPDNGWDWFPQYGGDWPPAEGNPANQLYNVTNYPTDYLERAYTDVAACYDYDDNLHIVWNSCFYDSAPQDPNFNCNLMHWCDTDPLGIEFASLVTPGYWDDGTIDCGIWNRTISKMSISAKDPIYHPDEPPYLFCTWTQFNLGDNAQNGYTNGDIYAAVSNDAGFTWTPGYNLTGTSTPDCLPGDCLSSHWSSLAENMYEGDLHIEYVCDRDAGAAPRGEGAWTDNEMMYLHTEQLPWREACGVLIELVDPPSWCYPPLKVLPGQQRIIQMKLKGLYTIPGAYEVTTDNPNVFCVLNCNGILNPQEEKIVELLIDCYEEGFLVVRIYVTYCIGTPDEDTEVIVLHVVQSEDYYECPRDPATWIQKDNCKLKAKFWANTEERVWDKRIVPEEKQKVIFSGGAIVATTWQGDTIVGRQDYSDQLTGARDTINVVESSIAHPDEEPECIIQKIHVKNTFICAWPLQIPNHHRWWWIDIHKQIIMYHDRPPHDCPNWKKEQIIKYIWITKSQPPPWWPMPGPQEYEDIYFGYFADIDAPDDECIALNEAGYDPVREMIWHRGVWNGLPPPNGHPQYDDYYVGLTFTDPTGAVVMPWGCQDVLNEDYLYPQPCGWGWVDQELYDLATTPGVNIHNFGQVADRTVVLTADMIPAGTGPFNSEFILIEAFIQGGPGTGLAELQAHIDDTRDILIPELNALGTIFSRDFPICGDCNEDGVVNIADVVYLISYLFQNGPPPSWPFNRGDVNHDYTVNIADVVYLLSYLFLNGPPPDCSGFGR